MGYTVIWSEFSEELIDEIFDYYKKKTKSYGIMDIQTRKIKFVQAFLQLESEELISRLEDLLKVEKKEKIKPMSLKEFNQRIDKALLDSESDRVTESSELIHEIG